MTLTLNLHLQDSRVRRVRLTSTNVPALPVLMEPSAGTGPMATTVNALKVGSAHCLQGFEKTELV